MRISGFASLLLVAVLLSSATVAAAAVTPKVSTTQRKDFSRISFDWPQNVRFKANSNGNTTTLSFSEPASIDLGAIKSKFGNRLTAATMSKDGKSLKLTFDQPYRIRHFISGNNNGIDVLGTNAPVNKNPAPAPKEEPEKKSDKEAKKPEKTDEKKDAKKDEKKAKKEAEKAAEKKAEKAKKSEKTEKKDAKTAAKKPEDKPADTPKAPERSATKPEPHAKAAPVPEVQAAEAAPPTPPAAAPEPVAEATPPAEAAPAAEAPKAKLDPKAMAKAAKAAAAQAKTEPSPAAAAPAAPQQEQPDVAPAQPEPAAQKAPAAAETPAPAPAEAQALQAPAAPTAAPAPPTPDAAPAQAEAAPVATQLEQPDVAAQPEPAVTPPAMNAPAPATETPPAQSEAPDVAAPATPDDEAPQDAAQAAAPEPAPEQAAAEATPTEPPPTVHTDPAPIPGVSGSMQPTSTGLPPDATPEEKANAEAAAKPVPALIDPKHTTQTEDMSAGNEGPFLITTRSLPNGIEIQFPWQERTAAAVFRRANDIWIVFDAPRELNLGILESILPAAVYKVKSIPYPGHSILHFQTDGSVYAQVRRPRNTQEWHITLSSYRQLPGLPVAMELKPSAAVPSITASIAQYAKPITIKDPTVGDELVIVPLYEPGEGTYPTRDFVELTVLETAQGLAMIKKADTAAMLPVRNALKLVGSARGISLSPNLPTLSIDELEDAKNLYSTRFPYEKWKVEPERFVEARRELEQKTIGASPARLSSLRQKIAEMYLGQGMGHEALGMINLIRSEDIGYYYQNQLSALRGVANFLIHRYGEAIADFNARDLIEDQEILMWREAMAIFQQDRPRFDYHLYYDQYISKYPPRLRERLAILAADNYINRRNYQRAFTSFDSMNKFGISAETIDYVNFLLGKIAAEQGRYDQAIALWQPLREDSPDRFIRARSEFALVTLMYNNGRLDAKEAIRRLDNLRIVWRGDAFEISLLNYLGQMYVDNNQPLQGLRAWRDLITNFPDSTLAIDVAKAMANVFNKLFAEGGADHMQPLEALATFYEFRDLVPIGAAGDKMIQALADRLASVDLLDRAAGLLQHQIQYRQEGEVRSRLGAQLALIHILNREPQKALDALELTGYGKNPVDLQKKRLRLTSMALNGIKEYQRALEMLQQDDSAEARQLRLDIYWNMSDWPNVITVAEEMLAARKDITAPLDGSENAELLKLALAYIFNGQASQLAYLRNFYLPLIKDEVAHRVFAFITDSATPIDPKKFDEVIKHANEVESFMQEFREKISKGGLTEALK